MFRLRFHCVLCSIVVGAITLSSPAPAHSADRSISEADRTRLEDLLPAKAPAVPKAERRLLIYDANVGYGGHRSIPYANYAFSRMGQKTGAFTAVIARDPAVFRKENLDQYDAVCLNNTVGNLFSDSVLRQNFLEFIRGGGGLLGIHGTTVAFTDFSNGAKETWPEFGRLLGGRGAAHLAADERVVIKIDSPDHPLNQPFGGKPFEHTSEFFRVHEPYSRERVHVLFSIDTAKTKLPPAGTHPGIERADNDYALAWTKSYGRGRVVYCTIGHSPQDFMIPKILEFYLGAIQFVLGDLPGPTTPSRSKAWQPLFDGKTLTGWHAVGDGIWTVEDGAIVGRADNEKLYGLLFTDQQYSNFTVRFQFKVLAGDSGFYIRTLFKEPDQAHGNQVQVGLAGSGTGGVYESYGRGWIERPADALQQRILKDRDWNEMVIAAHGGSIEVHVNGTKTAVIKGDPGRAKGHLALQMHSGNKMHVLFRKIAIREVP